jgi:hypothetical protein
MRRFFTGIKSEPLTTDDVIGYGLPIDKVSVYAPKATELPRGLAHWRDLCVEKMHIGNPPSIVVVEDEAWNRRNAKENGIVSGSAFPHWNCIMLPQSIVDELESGSVGYAHYVFCHEMGTSNNMRTLATCR